MKRDLALEILARTISENDIVVAVYQTLFDWLALTSRDLDYVSTGAMGQASSHGLGLAIANPDHRVFVFDGDGSLLMNLGSLVTIADVMPQNFYHILFENGTYEVNGGHPIPGRSCVDFAAIARSCGYVSSQCITSHLDLKSSLSNVFATSGPAFVSLKIEPGRTYDRNYEYIHSPGARQKFRDALNNRCSVYNRLE